MENDELIEVPVAGFLADTGAALMNIYLMRSALKLNFVHIVMQTSRKWFFFRPSEADALAAWDAIPEENMYKFLYRNLYAEDADKILGMQTKYLTGEALGDLEETTTIFVEPDDMALLEKYAKFSTSLEEPPKEN